jgi:anti-sigma factor RsiW
MSCPFHPQLQLFHDAELDVARREAVEQHLGQCAECAEEMGRLRRVSQVLDSADLPRPSDAFLIDLHRQVDAALGQQGVLRLARMLTAAASIVLVVGLIGLTSGRQSQAAQEWERIAVTLQVETPADESYQWVEMAQLMTGQRSLRGYDE